MKIILFKFKKIILNFLKVENRVTISRKDLMVLLSDLLPIECDLIRLGSKFDGGYLVPKSILTRITSVFSPGVYNDDNFEKYFAQQGIKCYLADFSVDSNPTKHENLIFDKVFIGSSNHRENFTTLSDWVNEKVGKETKSMLLAMDIEGSEYEVLVESNSEFLERFDVMCIEFHFFDELLYQRNFMFYRAVFDKLLRSFYVAHIHANNGCGSVDFFNFTIPKVIEFTFVNKKAISNKHIRTTIKNEFDNLNFRGNKEISIENWIKNLS